MRAGIAATIVTFAMSILAGCGGRSRPAPHLVERTRPAMGSELRLTAWTADEVSATLERLDGKELVHLLLRQAGQREERQTLGRPAGNEQGERGDGQPQARDEGLAVGLAARQAGGAAVRD